MAVKSDQKILKHRPHAKAGLSLRDERASLAGSSKNHIVSDAKTGNFISGPTSILADVTQIRLLGLWTLRGTLPSTVASTIVSPHPVLALDIPYNNVSIFEEVLDLLKSTVG